MAFANDIIRVHKKENIAIHYKDINHHTTPEFSRLTGVKAHDLRRWIRKGLLVPINIGKRKYIPETELERIFWLVNKYW